MSTLKRRGKTVKKMHIAYKFRIYPNTEQKILIHKTIGACRFIWNKMLEDKMNHYELTKEMLYNTPARYKETYSFLNEVDSLALANRQLHLERAFKSFFSKQTSFPNFQARKKDYGYTTNLVNGNIKVLDGFIKLPKLGLVKLKKHRHIPEDYKLRSVTVSKSKTGKYYISILLDYETVITPYEVKTTLGLDFDMTNFYVDSEGNRYAYPESILLDQQKLRRLQSSLSRRYQPHKKQKDQSKNYFKQQHRVAILHERITNKRLDFLHKLSDSIAKTSDSVSIETLDLKQMATSNKHYAKQISRFGWYKFITLLEYKLNRLGKALVKIDKWYPSSKMCSRCGHLKTELKLSERIYSCEHCRQNIDRDYNAAINIRNKGLELLKVKNLA